MFLMAIVGKAINGFPEDSCDPGLFVKYLTAFRVT